MPLFIRKPLPRCMALTALLSACCVAPAALAVGLGEVALQSALGKPLQARIALTHLGDLSSDQIKVSLGSDDDYARLGVERDYLHSQIRMQPVVDGANAYLRLSTSQPIVEPYINLVISLRWPNGQLAREYTLLLDIPPTAAPAPTAATPVAPLGNIAAAALAADAAADRRRDEESAAPSPASASARPRAAAPALPLDGRYRTARGDSLWQLANRLRPAGVSVEQMMAALYAANPGAFLNGSPSQLKEAVELKVPTASEASAAAPLASTSASPSTATAGAAAARTQPDAAVGDRFAGSRAVDTAAAGSDVAPAPQDDARLELLAPTDIEQLTVENAALREEVKSLTSNVGALTTQLGRSEQRLAQMEAQLQQVLAGYDRQRGVDGAAAAGNSPFADGRGQAVASEPADATGIDAAAPAPQREGSLWLHIGYWIALGAVGGWALYLYSRKQRDDEEEAAERALASLSPAPAALTPAPSPARVVAREPIVAQATVAAPPPVATAAAPAEPTDAAWGSAGDNERYWHHHTDSAEELPLDLLDAEPVAATPFAAAGAGSAGVEDSVDASISAGVFLAFGRYSEAEQVLQEALQRDPSRHDLQLQLLDVYQQADMRDAFEQLARAIENDNADAPEVVAEVAALRDSYSGRF